MILDETAIKNILLKRPNKKMVEDAQSYSRKLMMHMTGIGLKEYLENINGFERPGAQDIRQKYTTSNTDLFSRIHRPIDKVFSAKGGSCYYSLPDNQDKQFKQILSEVEYGYNMRRWMESFWRPAYHYDPMGMIFVEIDGKGNAYPTYKSVLDVYDYQPNGRDLDYVVFKTDKKIERVKKGEKITVPVYRIIDDAFDYLVEWDGYNYKTIAKETFPNYFLKVPAIIISDLFDQLRGYYISPDNDIIERADEFLTEGSVKSIYKKYFGFPQAWAYASDCPTCEGEGVFNGAKCPDCNGTGKKSKHNVWETINLPVPDKDDPKLTPDVAGYITPDVQGWDKMTQELQLLEEIMFRTYWGTSQVEESKSETATGRYIDVQPVNDRLNKFADAAEYVEDYVTDLLGQFYFGLTYKGASINYGRRFLIEPPDAIWEKYQNARKVGAPNSVLDNLLIEFYQTKYQSDSVEMQKYIKMLKVEPFVHMTVTELDKVEVPKIDYLKKLYFNEWLSTIEDNQLLILTVENLQQSLSAFIAPKFELYSAELPAQALPIIQQAQGNPQPAPPKQFANPI